MLLIMSYGIIYDAQPVLEFAAAVSPVHSHHSRMLSCNKRCKKPTIDSVLIACSKIASLRTRFVSIMAHRFIRSNLDSFYQSMLCITLVLEKILEIVEISEYFILLLGKAIVYFSIKTLPCIPISSCV